MGSKKLYTSLKIEQFFRKSRKPTEIQAIFKKRRDVLKSESVEYSVVEISRVEISRARGENIGFQISNQTIVLHLDS